MKTLVSFIIGVIIFCLGFYLDSLFIDWVISVLPKSAIEWFGLFRIILWVITFGITFGVSIWAAFILGGIVYILIGGEVK